MSLRLGSIRRSDTLLFQNTEEILAKELKKIDKDGTEYDKENNQFFITENELTLDDLARKAPLEFEYIPKR